MKLIVHGMLIEGMETSATHLHFGLRVSGQF